MKTEVEIAKLKQNWLIDPIWDIEDTEGFEDHEEELREFRIRKQDEWEKRRQKELKDYADSIGTDNLILAKRFLRLESYVDALAERINDLE